MAYRVAALPTFAHCSADEGREVLCGEIFGEQLVQIAARVGAGVLPRRPTSLLPTAVLVTC
jgi:hypothetical protein